jgi:hypothetical protein
MSKEMVLGVIRHILTFGGGLLATKGWVEDVDVATGVGAAVTLIGLVWSIIQKRHAAATTP